MLRSGESAIDRLHGYGRKVDVDFTAIELESNPFTGEAMLGAIAGDIIGSVHEGAGTKRKDFPLFDARCTFTDDTVLTVAVAHALLERGDYADYFHEYFRRYPYAGYGGSFVRWAAAIFLARSGSSKDEIRERITAMFGYALDATLDALRPAYAFDVSCQGSVPQSLIAFLESTSYEDTVRNAVSLGGDADTMACIAGAVAEAYYGGVPENIAATASGKLDDHLRAIVSRFKSATPRT